MADINVANDTEVFSDDYPIIYKTEDNHIAEKFHVENEMSKMNLPETVTAVV
mgnify:CR=1 FL=1